MKKRTAFSVVEASIVLILVGILVAGIVMARGTFFFQAKIDKIASANKSSPLRDMNGLSIWLDTATNESFNDSEFEENSRISKWKNISPNHYNEFNVLQSTPANQPSYIFDKFDDLPLIKFDGNNVLSSASIAGYKFLGVNQATIIIVQKYNFPNHNSKTINWDPSGANQIGVTALNSSGNLVFNFGAGQISSAAASFGYGWNIITLIKSNTSGIIRINGAILQNSTMNASINVSSSDNLDIGTSLNGALREVIIFNRELIPVEIREVERYLSNKWSIRLLS